MLPTPLAFAWVLWRHHGPSLLLVLTILLAAAVVSAVFPAYCSKEVAEWWFGAMLIVTASVIVIPVIVFVDGSDNTDLLGRESCFPATLLRLPVTTRALVAWPVVYGAALAMVLWPAMAWFIYRPWLLRLDKPLLLLWWPAALSMAVLSWIQALCWSAFGLRSFRLCLLVALYPVVGFMLAGLLATGASEGTLVGLFVAAAALGWMVSYAGVRRARRGRVPSWDGILVPLRRLTHPLPQRRSAFASASQAQQWHEWRLTGNSLAIATALVLPFALWPLPWARNDVLPLWQTLLGALALPVLLAGISGPWPSSGRSRRTRDVFSMMPFLATLPISSADLVGAMLKTAAWSVVTAWTVAVAIVSAALVLTGLLEDLAAWWRQAWRDHSSSQIAAATIALSLLLLVWTWKRRVDSLYLSLTGREWVLRCIAMMCLPGLLGLCLGVAWIYKRPAYHGIALSVLPWLLGILVLCRLLLAAWALWEVVRRGLLQPRTARRWLAAWLTTAAALFGLLAWANPPVAVPVYYLSFAVLFALPMARLAATPLALAWNRHRRLPQPL